MSDIFDVAWGTFNDSIAILICCAGTPKTTVTLTLCGLWPPYVLTLYANTQGGPRGAFYKA